MMNIENARQDLINRGYNPDDFNIVKFDGGFSISPKPSFEQRKVAKEEDAPIVNDVNDIGEVLGVTLDDTVSIAETVGALVDIVMDLQQELENLKGGN